MAELTGGVGGGRDDPLRAAPSAHDPFAAHEPPPPALPTENELRRKRSFGAPWAWAVFLIGVLYFVIPLYATFEVSMRAKPLFAAYGNSFTDPSFWRSLLYSFVAGLITVGLSIALVVPTAYWVRLRVPRLRPVVEFITLLPFVIPPVVLVFGLIRAYSRPPLPLTNTDMGSNALLVFAYVALSLPYMFRSVDAGLRAIDIRTLTEAAQSLGSGWFTIVTRIILPNLRVSLLSGAFLSLAIVIGEFTIASYLARKAFGPYLQLLGANRTYEPAAVTIISFGLTWLAMIAISLLGRGSRAKIQVGGAR